VRWIRKTQPTRKPIGVTVKIYITSLNSLYWVLIWHKVWFFVNVEKKKPPLTGPAKGSGGDMQRG
jgi:hypothetical protein